MLRGGSLLAALVLVPMLWLALSAQRHVPLFGFAAVPFIAGPVSELLHEVGTTVRRGTGRVRRSAVTVDHVARGRALGLPLAGAMWLGALASMAVASNGPDLRPYPIRAVDALTASSGILLNEYDWGGYLIWAVPSRPVFVDGRLYPFAGNGVIRAYQEAVNVLPSWRAVIERWNVAQALIRPDRGLVQALRDEGWTVRAEGDGFVLLERPR